MTYYVFETMNETAVGPFADEHAAQEWMLEVVPPEDILGTHENEAADYSGQGYRVGTPEEVREQLSSPVWETPDAAKARYAECYAEYYPNFRHGEK